MSVTVSFADLPGETSGVFLPAIWKSCATLPLLTSVKVTLPCVTVDGESLNLNSVAVTVTVAVLFELLGVFPEYVVYQP